MSRLESIERLMKRRSDRDKTTDWHRWIKRGVKEVTRQPIYGKMDGESLMNSANTMAALTANIEAPPTAVLRQELEASGVSLPGKEEMLSLSKQFNG